MKSLSACLIFILVLVSFLGVVGEKNRVSREIPSSILLARPEELAFPESEAGMSAYVNIGKSINVTKAVEAFTQVIDVGENYAIGEIEDIRVYVDSAGWVVAYLDATEPVAKMMWWWEGFNPEKPAVSFKTMKYKTRLEHRISKVCDRVGVNYLRDVRRNIKYYHFQYPEAIKLMILIKTRTERIKGSSYVHIYIPLSYNIYEVSYSLMASGGNKNSRFYIDSTHIDGVSDGYRYGFIDLDEVYDGSPHTFELWGDDDCCWAGLAVFILYK